MYNQFLFPWLCSLPTDMIYISYLLHRPIQDQVTIRISCECFMPGTAGWYQFTLSVCVGTAYVPCPRIRIATSYRVISTAIWSKRRQFYQCDTEKSIAKDNIFISLVSTVNADGLAPSGARTSACTVMTRFVPRIYGTGMLSVWLKCQITRCSALLVIVIDLYLVDINTCQYSIKPYTGYNYFNWIIHNHWRYIIICH